MKITRAEKIWLGLIILFYALYNIPFFPAYGDAAGLIIHGALTIIPLWIVVFVGYPYINRIYKPKEDPKSKETMDPNEGGAGKNATT